MHRTPLRLVPGQRIPGARDRRRGRRPRAGAGRPGHHVHEGGDQDPPGRGTAARGGPGRDLDRRLRARSASSRDPPTSTCPRFRTRSRCRCCWRTTGPVTGVSSSTPGAEPSGAADPRGRPGPGPRAGGNHPTGPARRVSVFPVEYVELARAESERGELVLRQRRDDGAASVLELRANGVFVMDTAETTSEVALAAAALDLVDDPRDVLVGGIGLGFTMHAVLADPRVERCTVVEIEEALVGWMRDGTIQPRPDDARRRARPPRRGRRLARARRGARGDVRPGAARRRQRPAASWSTRATPRIYERAVPRRGTRGSCGPAARSRSGLWTRRPALQAVAAGACSTTPSAQSPSRRLQDRDETLLALVGRVVRRTPPVVSASAG